jgi:diguanylate cyclase (GGDEF)-like protein
MSNPSKVRILFLAANPRGTPWIQLDEEIRAITKRIQESSHPDSLELISMWAVRTDDLLQGLNKHKPHIVHFSAHGTRVGEIIFVSEGGKPKAVGAKALRALFETLRDNVRVVVLNACYSKIQAAAISEVIDCVVGIQNSLQDSFAIAFAASFYSALGFGRSVQEAFEQGRVAILLEGGSEHDTPDLLVRTGVNPAKVYLLDDEADYGNSESEIEIIFREHKKQENYEISLVFMDLDKFAGINKRFGKRIGDEVIQIVADIFQKGFQKSCYYLEKGTQDEFWACVKGNDQDAANLAKRVKRQIQRYPWDVVAPGLYVTGSFGVAQLNEKDVNVRHWMLRAVLGAQNAKKSGGNQVYFGPYVLPKDMEDDISGFLS